MASKLAIVALTGLAASAICLGAAVAIGGQEVMANGFDLSDFSTEPSCQYELSGKTGSRTIAWDGSDHVSIAMHADAHYHRGQGDQLVVNGDTAVLPHIKVDDGEIKMDCRRNNRGAEITITLPGRIFQKFGLAGSGTLTLDGIDQPQLKIGIAGSGNIQGTGKTDDLVLGIAGSGKMKLAQLAANNVSVHVAGSGDTEISPRDDLDVHIAGSGKIHLMSEPKHVETHIAGSGTIIRGQ